MPRLAVLAAALAALLLALPAQAQEKSGALATAIFASGCFWCTEADFDKVDGVVETTSGYTGGRVENPSYEQVSAGGTGHTEALKVTYDPAKVDYADLLRVYWRNVDPFDDAGQFCDRGTQYRPGIFVSGPDQRAAAEASVKAAEQALGKPVVVPVEDASTFYPAEDYHQGYYKRNPIRYGFYRTSCGRDARLEQVWDGVPALDF